MTNEHNPDGKEIRFIDSHYKDLFHIPDGSCVQIHYPDETVVKPCTFIDEYHTQIGYNEQIKATERSADYERDDLQTDRRLSDSEPSVGERGRETSGQVRQDASSIFGAEQSDAPERHDSDGEPVPAPVGDRGNGESQSGISDGAVSEGQSRTEQGNAADGVGAAHEQPESTGGGSRDDGAYQQLSLNLFLSENEQISFIDRAESFTPSALAQYVYATENLYSSQLYSLPLGFLQNRHFQYKEQYLREIESVWQYYSRS